jgi:glycosyltransferase involved in cell wall biosynthesis
LKIAFLRTDEFEGDAGGSFSHIAGFTDAMLRAGHKLFFIASGQPTKLDTTRTPFYLIEYPPLFFEFLPELCHVTYNYRFVKRALPILRKEQPDLLYHRHSDFNCSSVILSRLLKIPLILEVNNSEVWLQATWGNLYLRRLCQLFEEIAFQGAHVVAVVSAVLKRDLINLGVPAEKIIVNPNGVDPLRFHPNLSGDRIRYKYGLNDRVVVGFLGTFGVWHGIPVLAEAIGPVIKQNNEVHFFLIGDGVLKPEVEQQVKMNGLTDYVTFTGIVPHQEVPEYLASCDILVSPHTPMVDGTEFFGSPTKLFEYMAMGKGIVASNLGQIGEILGNNQTAILTKPGSVEDIVEGILELASSPELREELGRQAHQEVTKAYTWDQNAARVVEAYERFKSSG